VRAAPFDSFSIAVSKGDGFSVSSTTCGTPGNLLSGESCQIDVEFTAKALDQSVPAGYRGARKPRAHSNLRSFNSRFPYPNKAVTINLALSLLYGSGTSAPAETGLKIASDGVIIFAAGQNFPDTGAGTVISVGSGAGQTGGPITSSGSLSVANRGVGKYPIADDGNLKRRRWFSLLQLEFDVPLAVAAVEAIHGLPQGSESALPVRCVPHAAGT
jgi:hypothetical protein